MAKRTAPKKTAAKKVAPKKAAAKKAAAKKAAPKKTAARSSGAAKEVVVGRLTDWPLGARLVKLMGLPEAATSVGCFQVVGRHGDAVSAKVFEVKETIPPDLAPFESRIHAALGVCREHRGSSVTSNTAFHANLSPEELAEHLRKDYLVRTPAEALEARRLTPAQSLRKIEKALEKASIGCPRKYLLEYLEGGAPRGGLLDARAHELSKLHVAHPEVFNEVDARLFHLWARRAQDGDGPPMPPSAPELGFDRFGAHVEQLVAAGLQKDAAVTYFLRRLPMAHARWWPSTGVWVWERLLGDPSKLIQHNLAKAVVEPFPGEIEGTIAEMLISVLWLPEGVLEAGAREAVLKVCARPSLVPDASLEMMREDDEIQPMLASLERSDEPHAPARPTVTARRGSRLIAS